MDNVKAALFSHATSTLEFSKSNFEHNEIEQLKKLYSLGSDSFFKMNDFLNLLLRMEYYFENLEKSMIEQANNENSQLIKTTENKHLLKYLIDKHRTDLSTIGDIVASQLDAVSLGIFFRVHAFLEEVLKKICKIIQDAFSLKGNYQGARRSGKFRNDNISTFEKCVIYIDQSSLLTKLDLYTYDYLFEWNKVRNILIHAGGEISKSSDYEHIEKLNLKTFKSQSRRLIYNPDMSLKEDVIEETPPKIKLSTADIIKYVLNIDRFLAILINPDVIASFKQSEEIKNTAINELVDKDRFKEVFSDVFNQIKSNKNVAKIEGVSEMDAEYEEYLMESLKLLIDSSDFLQ